jgi:ribosomal protein L16/L10AE
MFEISGVTKEEAFHALRIASAKLPVKSIVVDRK